MRHHRFARRLRRALSRNTARARHIDHAGQIDHIDHTTNVVGGLPRSFR